ncbi:MAG: D-tyrosyl-tRNA(Tyr) deacylase [Deferribacteres bacterium]|nr:D-tyrosyl-tRNA(Tyr) deacylase [candidate division KSB1 bacterium]MCB9500360.1 D-tyrosyl-tRNA(Tyr) deacylase [Deferribacteres bacterium]
MRALIQRVSQGSVTIEGKVVGKIGTGIVLLLGIKNGDNLEDIKYIANKCVNLRIFNDESGNLNKSLLEIGGEMLIISQFTLYGDARKGRRPGFSDAAPPEIAEPLYNDFVSEVRRSNVRVATGEFGAMMQILIKNEGPVTLMIESRQK